MLYRTACETLELPVSDGKKRDYVKRQYRLLSLRYHPDKNPDTDTTKQFQEINAAYQELMRQCRDLETDTDTEADDDDPGEDDPLSNQWLRDMIAMVKTMETKNVGAVLWDHIAKEIIRACENRAVMYLETLDKTTLEDFYDVIGRHRHRFQESFIQPIVLRLETLLNVSLQERRKHDRVLTFRPHLDDLFDCNVIQHEETDVVTGAVRKYMIPTWMERTIFDEPVADVSGSLREFVVCCLPTCPEGVVLDADGNLHRDVYYFVKELWDHPEKDPIEVVLTPRRTLHLYKHQLGFRQTQTVVFKGKGVPIGNRRDIFDVSKKGDVCIHVHMMWPDRACHPTPRRSDLGTATDPSPSV